MIGRSRRLMLAPLVFAVGFAGCDSAFGPESETRILMSQSSSAGASFSVSPAGGDVQMDRKGGGTAVLALVESLDVTITAVQAQQAQFVDSPDRDEGWETLTFADPVTVDLLSLPTAENGLEIVSGDLPPGPYVRLRFLVSEADLTLRAPLTVGRNTFPAGEPIDIHIPRAWVSVPGAVFTVTEEEGAIVQVEFDPSTSLGQLAVSENGRLSFTPVMRGSRWADDDWRDHHDDDDWRDDHDDDDDD